MLPLFMQLTLKSVLITYTEYSSSSVYLILPRYMIICMFELKIIYWPIKCEWANENDQEFSIMLFSNNSCAVPSFANETDFVIFQ